MEQEKTKSLNRLDVNMYNSMYYQPTENTSNPKNQKLESFKSRLDAFKKIKTLEEAKDLLNRTMPVQLERTVFFIGDAKCTIINRDNQLRLCLQSSSEFISYNFI